MRLEPGAMRELHWHPNAAEWQFYIAGKGRMTVFFPVDNARTMDFNANDVGYVPSNAPHYIENTGDTDLVFLETFATDQFKRVCQPLLFLDGPGLRGLAIDQKGLAAGGICTQQRHLVTEIEKLKGKSKADAGRASGDENGTAGEFHMSPFVRSTSGQSKTLLALASSFSDLAYSIGVCT